MTLEYPRRRQAGGSYGQGTVTVLNRQTSFGTFGGGDAIIAIPCINVCGTSGGNDVRRTATSTQPVGAGCGGWRHPYTLRLVVSRRLGANYRSAMR
jgi:hypothetical protein